jgi:uncharacterized protein HemX
MFGDEQRPMEKGIAPGTLIAAIVVVIMTLGLGGAFMQFQFASVSKTQETAEATIKEREKILLDRIEKLEEAARKQAREPVEKATLDAINAASDKRIELIQSQITDINRQIAAALVIIDSNAGAKKMFPVPP